MQPKAQNSKSVIMTWATLSTSATSSSRVDRLGFEYADITVVMPVATATNSSAKWASCTILHGDSTAVSSATAVTALTGTTNSSTTSGFVIAAQNDTSNPQVTRLGVDCRGKGRYLFLQLQGAASHHTAYAIANLYTANELPDTDTKKGVAVSANG